MEEFLINICSWGFQVEFSFLSLGIKGFRECCCGQRIVVPQVRSTMAPWDLYGLPFLKRYIFVWPYPLAKCYTCWHDGLFRILVHQKLGWFIHVFSEILMVFLLLVLCHCQESLRCLFFVIFFCFGIRTFVFPCVSLISPVGPCSLIPYYLWFVWEGDINNYKLKDRLEGVIFIFIAY